MRTFACSLLLVLAAPAWADTRIETDRLFAPSSIRVLDDATAWKFLEGVAEHLSEDRSRTVRLEVHADELLGRTDNTYLAAHRARAVEKALRKLGVRKRQLTTESVGHSGVAHAPQTACVLFDFSDDAEVAWPGK